MALDHRRTSALCSVTSEVLYGVDGVGAGTVQGFSGMASRSRAPWLYRESRACADCMSQMPSTCGREATTPHPLHGSTALIRGLRSGTAVSESSGPRKKPSVWAARTSSNIRWDARALHEVRYETCRRWLAPTVAPSGMVPRNKRASQVGAHAHLGTCAWSSSAVEVGVAVPVHRTSGLRQAQR